MSSFASAIFLCSIAVLFAIQANAYTTIQLLDDDPLYPDECVIRKVTETGESETRYSIGHEWQTGKCEKSTCIKSDNKLLISTFGCGVGRVELPCKMLPVDYAKPYPECCPQPWCPEVENVEE